MSDLKAISIRQPWLDLIMKGVKVMDIRSWEMKHRGLIALHAPRQIDMGAAYFFGYQAPWTLVRGKLVGVAEVEQVITLDKTNFMDYLDQHLQVLPIDGIAYGIVLRNIRLLDKPIAYSGRQMLFPLDSDTAEVINNCLQR
jgi:hypothetical protein